jgi:23S rRNA (uridine2552-2'-O)-methyltransferase
VSGRDNPWAPGDAWNERARREGFAARSVYKLDEIDARWKLLRRGLRVLDLGAAPGSWSQYALRRIGPGGLLVAVDLAPITVPLPGAIVLRADVFALDEAALAAASVERAPPFDIVLSDMAPRTTGVPFRDHVASIELCDRALDLACRWLAVGGVFVCKVFQGEDEPALRKRVADRFVSVQAVKPKATRGRSVETFYVATGRKAPAP